MIKRSAEKKLKELAKGFPTVAVIGPRQSGKTTLVKMAFSKKPYVLLEDPETRMFAENDPKGFLAKYPDGAIIDEAQRVPQLFSYLQGIIDAANKPGMFILTGSHNFLLMEKVTQSLSGRIAILKLLPFSIDELRPAEIEYDSYEEYLFKGMYPRLYDMKINPQNFYSSYIQTYLERDLRLLLNIQNLSAFHIFLKMCAHRTGQLLNLSSLANDCGITHNTAKKWLSLLETSFIIYLLRPHHGNFNKRLVKMPKLYFVDPGLAAHLADVQSAVHLENHPLKGPLFESLIITEFLKKRFNSALESNLFFWRDKTGHEIDCIFDQGDRVIPIEIKSGRTITEDYFTNMNYWNRLSGNDPKKSFIVYGGTDEQRRSNGHVISWKGLGKVK